MLLSLAILFITSIFLGGIFSKLNLPPLLGILLGGIVLGVSGFDILDAELMQISPQLKQIALIIILLRAGLGLNLRDLFKVGRSAFLMSFVPACFEIFAIAILAPWLLGISLIEALVLGSVLAAVSPAVIVPRMLDLSARTSGNGRLTTQLVMAGASLDDIFVIVLFSSFSLLALGGEFAWISLLDIPLSIVSGIILGVFSGWVSTYLFRKIKLNKTIKVLILLSISFGFLALEQALKDTLSISALLAVMSMGLSISWFYPELSDELKPDFSKLWIPFEMILFVMVGACVNFTHALNFGFTPVFLIFSALVLRIAGVALSLIGTQFNFKERLFCSFAYLPKATVQAALGSVPLAMGLPVGELVLSIAVLSIIITAPLGAIAIDKSAGRLIGAKK